MSNHECHANAIGIAGKRKRPSESDEDSSFCEEAKKKKKKKKKKKQDQDSHGPAKEDNFKKIMGEVPSLEVKISEPGMSLKPQDIQSLLLWILGEGTMPRLFFVKNSSLIPKVFVLMLNSLGQLTYFRHSAALPTLVKSFNAAIPTKSPGSKTRVYSFMQALLNVPLKGKAKKEKKKKGSTANIREDFPPTYYVLSLGQLQENQFPLRSEHMPAPNDEAARPRYGNGPPLDTTGFVETRPAKVPLKPGVIPAIYGLDCEMCYTERGLELTRCTLVDRNGAVVYDQLCVPENPITDYNTKYSGITEKMLNGCTKRLQDIQEDVLKLVSAETILVGHSLENDLVALKMIHYSVIDTSVIYPDQRGAGYKSALRVLTQRYLGRTIQNNAAGHSSAVDAKAALDLAFLKFQRGPTFGEASGDSGESIFVHLARTRNPPRCAIADRVSLVKTFGGGAADLFSCSTDAETADACASAARGDTRFMFAQFHDLETYYRDTPHEARTDESLAEVLSILDGYVAKVASALPAHSLLCVVTGHSDQTEFKRLMKERKDRMDSPSGMPWTTEQEAMLEREATITRNGLSFFAVLPPTPRDTDEPNPNEAVLKNVCAG